MESGEALFDNVHRVRTNTQEIEELKVNRSVYLRITQYHLF